GNNKRDYLYLKSKQELESTLWAKANAKISDKGDFIRLPETVNSKNSEFGHNIIDGKLIFSSLRADSISENEEVYETSYSTLLYSSKVENGDFNLSERIEEFYKLGTNVGNSALSLDG